MKKVLFIFLFIFMLIGCRNQEKSIYHDELYKVAIQYLIDQDTNLEKSRDRYKLFVDYKEFGIVEDDEYRYVYMWIAEESYYVVDQKIVSGSGSSMPYKFTVLLDDNTVVKYEIPKDGSEYVSSIKEMFPDDIENKVIHFQWKDHNLIKKVRDYYSDLSDKNIYYYTGSQYVKLDK